MQTDDTTSMAGKCLQAFACPPVPHFHGAIHTSTDKFGVIKLYASNSRLVTMQRPDLLPSVNIPNLDGCIVGSSSENIVVKLKAHHAISVAPEYLGGTSAIFPVRANLESIFVDIFPWSLVDGLLR